MNGGRDYAERDYADQDYADWSATPQAPAPRSRPTPRSMPQGVAGPTAGHPAPTSGRPTPTFGRPHVHITQSPPDPVLPRRAARGGSRPSALGERLGRRRPTPPWAGPLVAAAIAAGTGVGFGMITVSGDGPGLGDPLADRPHVTDHQAGVSYGIPADWQEFPKDPGLTSLPAPFSSGVTSTLDGPDGAAVMVTSTLDHGDLQDIAADQLELVVSLNLGTDQPDADEADPTWLDGREAAVSTVTLDTPDGTEAAYRCMAFAGDAGRTVIVVSVLTEDAGSRYQADLSAVLASMRVI